MQMKGWSWFIVQVIGSASTWNDHSIDLDRIKLKIPLNLDIGMVIGLQ